MRRVRCIPEQSGKVTGMFGFTQREFTDHTLAAFLREHKAIDNYEKSATSNQWRTPDNRVLVVAIYSGERGMAVKYWVRDDISPVNPVKIMIGHYTVSATVVKQSRDGELVVKATGIPDIVLSLLKRSRVRIRTYKGVRYVAQGHAAPASFASAVTCNTCGRTWDDGMSTELTPAPSGRCPFEYMHTVKAKDAPATEPQSPGSRPMTAGQTSFPRRSAPS